jgi:hypothetical protein
MKYTNNTILRPTKIYLQRDFRAENIPSGNPGSHQQIIFCQRIDLNVSRGVDSGCRLVYFQPQNPNLGTFWRVLLWKMLVYFMANWFILQQFGIFFPFWCEIARCQMEYFHTKYQFGYILGSFDNLEYCTYVHLVYIFCANLVHFLVKFRNPGVDYDVLIFSVSYACCCR